MFLEGDKGKTGVCDLAHPYKKYLIWSTPYTVDIYGLCVFVPGAVQ